MRRHQAPMIDRRPRRGIVGSTLRTRPSVVVAAAIAAATAFGGATHAVAAAPSTERVSVATGGTAASTQGSGTYNPPQTAARLISADGRYVAFESEARDLVGSDSNGVSDVFLRDRRAGTTVRASVSSSGKQANGTSSHASLSANGRYVAFQSAASNLVAGDSNGVPDVFVHDRKTRKTTRVSVTSTGGQISHRWGATVPVISANGRYVSFVSYAPDLAPEAPGESPQVFVHDRQTKQTTLASIASTGEQTPGVGVTAPSISGDGRFVAFAAPSAGNLLMGHPDSSINVFVRDRQAGTTERVSLRSDGTNGGRGQVHSEFPAISANGRYVAFASTAPNLVDGDPNGGQSDVFVHDRQTRQTTRVSAAAPQSDYVTEAPATHPSISADGRYVAFEAAIPGSSDSEVFRHDRQSGTTIRISAGPKGVRGTGRAASISGDGQHVVFTSYTSKLVPGPAVNWRQLFVRDVPGRWRPLAPQVRVVGRTAKSGRPVALKTRGIGDGQRLVVTWTPAKRTPGSTVRSTSTVRGDRASVRAPRSRGGFSVRVTLRGKLVGKASVRVR